MCIAEILPIKFGVAIDGWENESLMKNSSDASLWFFP